MCWLQPLLPFAQKDLQRGSWWCLWWSWLCPCWRRIPPQAQWTVKWFCEAYPPWLAVIVLDCRWHWFASWMKGRRLIYALSALGLRSQSCENCCEYYRPSIRGGHHQCLKHADNQVFRWLELSKWKYCEISARDLWKPFREFKNRKFLPVSKCWVTAKRTLCRNILTLPHDKVFGHLRNSVEKYLFSIL